ncbi:uncharacterized protein LOC108911583 [Anoplophora glabripennis]|uniref:Uncharacterized protein n=1 Tax=Anoplophora glabripennis TaxID=217634 RepID=V5GXL9_ANOGL|nr:uncharacterized protein LOC108911583 [Anoplophora glabripennis]
MQDLSQFFSKYVFILLVVTLIFVNARPSHLSESSQLLPDQESNMIDSGYKQWQMEMLAQKLAELNQLGNGEYGLERSLRSGNEIKRQSRYRLCYFNPVSCFKK